MTQRLHLYCLGVIKQPHEASLSRLGMLIQADHCHEPALPRLFTSDSQGPVYGPGLILPRGEAGKAYWGGGGDFWNKTPPLGVN